MRVWRKAIYVLTVRRTVERLAHYWRRAFLLDYMIFRNGYIRAEQSNQAARDPAAQNTAILTFYTLLEEEHSDTLTDLAVAALRTIPNLPEAVKNAVRTLGQIVKSPSASPFRTIWPTTGIALPPILMT